jgi:hypothetical protein
MKTTFSHRFQNLLVGQLEKVDRDRSEAARRAWETRGRAAEVPAEVPAVSVKPQKPGYPEFGGLNADPGGGVWPSNRFGKKDSAATVFENSRAALKQAGFKIAEKKVIGGGVEYPAKGALWITYSHPSGRKAEVGMYHLQDRGTWFVAHNLYDQKGEQLPQKRPLRDDAHWLQNLEDGAGEGFSDVRPVGEGKNKVSRGERDYQISEALSGVQIHADRIRDVVQAFHEKDPKRTKEVKSAMAEIDAKLKRATADLKKNPDQSLSQAREVFQASKKLTRRMEELADEIQPEFSEAKMAPIKPSDDSDESKSLEKADSDRSDAAHRAWDKRGRSAEGSALLQSKAAQDARAFSERAHAGQSRKYTGEPYATHPAAVASMVAHLPGATEEMVVAAYLHDTIEDTGAKPEEIEAAFGPKVRKLTEELTNPSSKGENKPLPRAERRAMDREHLAHVSPEAKRIKLMDRLHNLMGAKNSPKDYALTLLAPETRALVSALGDVDPESKKRVLDEVDRMEAHHRGAK